MPKTKTIMFFRPEQAKKLLELSRTRTALWRSQRAQRLGALSAKPAKALPPQFDHRPLTPPIGLGLAPLWQDSK